MVFIHCEYPYKGCVLPITDVAVPLFFGISGYFIYGTNRNWKRTKRILAILTWSAALYLLKTEAFWLLSSHQLYVPTWKNIIDFVLFNDVAFSIHLWYLPAYIYVLVAAFFIDKWRIWGWGFCAIVPLLLVGAFIRQAIAGSCPEEIQYYRNAYFCGLPYFLLGAFVKKQSSCITGKCKNASKQTILSIAILLLFVARYCICSSSFVWTSIRELNLILLTYCILLFTATTIQKRNNIFSELGRSYSLYIYIFHLLIMQVFSMAVGAFGEPIRTSYLYFCPIFVFLLSIALTYVLQKSHII